MARVETTTPQGLPDVETGRRLFRTMALIRRFEERTEEQYTRARIGGYCHLAIGEEAATVGAIDVLEDGDCLFASYRDHGTALAVGSEPAAVMAELFGKETGVAHGRGGSMHLLDTGRRFFGGWGIVGGHLPIAVGAGLALDQTGQQDAVLCQFGEGATNTGALPRGPQPGRRLGAPRRLPGDQQPVRHGHVGRPGVRRAGDLQARRRLPHARRAGGRQRCAGRARGGGAGCLPRRATTAARRCWRRSPTGTAATPLPTPAKCTGRPRRSPAGSARIRSRGSARCSPSTGCWARTTSRRSGSRSEPRSRRPSTSRAGRRLPRRRQPVRARLRRSRLARAVRADATPARPFGERGEERSWPT